MIVNTEVTLQRYYIRRPGAQATFLPHPEGTPGIYRPSRVVINALGLRGRLPTDSDRFKVLVLGGSGAEDALLNDEDTWCGRLETLLGPGVWVGNMGRSATNARHHAIQLRETLPYLPTPDAILVMCGVNDMLADLGCHGAEAEPTPGICFGAGPGIDDGLDGQTFDLGASIWAFKKRRREVRPEDWIDNFPSPAVALDRHAETLGKIAGLGPVIFVTQPALWRFGMGEAEDDHCYAGGVGGVDTWVNPRTPWYRAFTLAMLLALYNDAMRLTARRCGVALVDLADQLPREIENYYDDFHFSRIGASRVARIVAAFLAQRARP